ncbi:2-hydroxyacid dehydrogenase [Aquibium oceanicum]|uniref:2-hydroxyacid dehydrogenase n=1 Tax=Aquibium oceanicum TaxID=1670800 RepID=UPI000AB70B38|nr:2-hydroxyacid dehydrogenase [Aquibium oceanicum]
MGELGSNVVLVPGKLHPHAVTRLKGEFDLVTIDRSDSSLVDAVLAAKVRGLAVSTRIDAAFIDAFPALEIIASFGVGYDAVDAGHAAKRGVVVTNTPDVLTEEVADTTIGLLLNTVREFAKAENYLRAGRWVKDGNYPLTEMTLRGRTVGIFGLGRIGRAIARRIEAFGLPVSYHNRNRVDDVPYAYHPSLVELAAAVDTLICVAPGGAATEKAVNAQVLEALGPDGVLINVGRGTTVDEPALAKALKDRTIRAAGLDVFADEPNVPEDLLELDNATLLPHVGSASIHTREAMADLVVDNLISWFSNDKALTPVPETAGITRARR